MGTVAGCAQPLYAAMMHVSLIVPAPFDTISGGYEYDRRMVAGLRTFGYTVAVVELPGRHKQADTAARDAACATMDQLAPGTRCIVDGLALPAFAGLEDALAATSAIGLIHHPTALETGLGAAERTALQALERRLFGHLARVIVTSEFTGETMAQSFGVDPARIAIVAPGTDNAPRSTGSSSPTCEILSVGSLIPRKGHDVLLRALARLFDLNWHLTIAGSPDIDPVHALGLRSLVEELGIGQRVRFAGTVSDAALERLWHRADLFALATHYEGYGMAVAEALKRGLPVAITAGGAAAALVGPEAGVVCQAGDHEQLSKALRRLIFSNELRREMGEVAWATGQALPSWADQAQRFADAIAV
ncbi:MAG: glycosyltransferase family 4 protein [Acetobacteraceae bacterium]|nr:glycosyltransferase family 4 protein [Acetobacteraceae bacterium]